LSEIPLPSMLVRRHFHVFFFALAVFLAGCILGTTPQRTQEIMEEAEKIEIDVYNIPENIRRIYVNNAVIGIILFIASFTVILGANIMLNNVGVVFGAVVFNVPPLWAIVTLSSFGVLEALSFTFIFTAGLLIPVYGVKKLVGYSDTSFVETLSDCLWLLIYGLCLLLPAAVIEALLINPNTVLYALTSGPIITIFAVYSLLNE